MDNSHRIKMMGLSGKEEPVELTEFFRYTKVGQIIHPRDTGPSQIVAIQQNEPGNIVVTHCKTRFDNDGCRECTNTGCPIDLQLRRISVERSLGG